MLLTLDSSVIIAENVRANLENMDTIYFVELIKSSAKEAAAISAETGLKGIAKKVCKIKSTLQLTSDKL